MSSVAGNNTKRRRVCGDNSASLCLSDLSSGALAHVSSFLASPSRALFAVALTCRDVERSSAVVGDQCDALDFGHTEKELAAKLSDEDISAVFTCIDAVNNLKKLRLTNCINITGVGLEPLRGTAIIEQIDLSLVADHESPELDPEPLISCNDVLPILDSIIERGGESALKHLQFPKVWRKERNTESDFHAFLTRYNEYLVNRDVSCLKCNENLPGGVNQMLQMGRVAYAYASQNYTCCNCMNHYCDDCEDDNVGCISDLCGKCERHYCLHCSREEICACCDGWFCVDCDYFKQCSRCQDNTCPECISEMGCHSCGVDSIWCQYCVDLNDAIRCCEDCNESYCVNCCDSDVYAVKFCNVCEGWLCGNCRAKKCKEGRNCTGCYRLALPSLMEEKERQLEGMRSQNDELRNENRELKNQISALKKEINELKSSDA